MTANSSKIETKIAETAAELRAVERLRYEVFVSELGAIGAGVDHALRLERDQFDLHADHLIAVDKSADDAVVGVYRLLTAEMAAQTGRFYSEDEYEVSGLRASGRRLLELGRSCVHPDYRGGTTMFQLWQGLAKYIDENRIEILFGVASFHGTDPNQYAHALSNLSANYLAEEGLRPMSKNFERMDIIPPSEINRTKAIRDTPALIKSYLRLGGVIGDGAFIDHDFNTIDVCLVLDTRKLSAKYRNIYAKSLAQ